jgi:hypothetical protein
MARAIASFSSPYIIALLVVVVVEVWLTVVASLSIGFEQL